VVTFGLGEQDGGLLMYSDDIAIQVSSVSKTYTMYKRPSDQLKQLILGEKRACLRKFTALHQLSLTIPKGRTVGIVGRNGSGKSTLLQIIAGVLTPTTGHVQVNGRVAALLELGAGFNPEFTGRENVFLNASILGVAPEEVERKYKEIVDFAEIGEFIDQPVKTYSSGMFVRLAFAVSTLTDPDIVIIDEALSVGDEKFQRKCYDHLEKLREKGCTILFVTHSMKIVEQICDYAYLIDNGYLVGEGKPKDVIDQYHMLLYSMENDHFKALNQQEPLRVVDQQSSLETTMPEVVAEKKSGITSIKMYNDRNEEVYFFKSGEKSRITMKIEVDHDVDDVSIGIRIKSTEGIEVYGTSTAYYDEQYNLRKDRPLIISFYQELTLVSGTYHLSVAVAKKTTSNDMFYIDKLSDHIVFKVDEMPIRGTGIANLKSRIVVEG
jgi:ABC-type polysaccharide/polyol phosphate transport system, ATPase component